LVPYCLGP